ncbi:MAG: FISUMP domain-containing protein [Candidatus Saccharimonas sp.]
MKTKQLIQRLSNAHHSAFTIVELLIVIVIIAILATITIVAYNGITNRAHESSLKSDLNNGSKLLEIVRTIDGTYPANLDTVNNGYAFKASGDNYAIYNTNPPTYDAYCLEVHYPTTDPTMSFFITNTGASSQQGTCTGTAGIPGGTPAGGAIAAVPIQTVTSANCPAARTRTLDLRDNHTYWVQKLTDGKCWMLTNLAYIGGGVDTYHDVKLLSDGTDDNSATYTVAKYYVPTGGPNFTVEPADPSTYFANTDDYENIGQYGYLYNWCAAMGVQTASSACANAATPTPNTDLTICPAGWRLPTGNGGEFAALNAAVNGGLTNTDIGLRSTWLGQRSGFWHSDGGYTGLDSQGFDGLYWSSLQGGATYSFALTYGIYSQVNLDYTVNKGSGLAVRCVAV